MTDQADDDLRRLLTEAHRRDSDQVTFDVSAGLADIGRRTGMHSPSVAYPVADTTKQPLPEINLADRVESFLRTLNEDGVAPPPARIVKQEPRSGRTVSWPATRRGRDDPRFVEPDRRLVLIEEDRWAEIAVPADGGYLGVLHTAAAGIAARLHFALDEIEDLRIAVDEACAMLLAVAGRGADLKCRFTVADDALTVEVSVATIRGAKLPPASSFAWRLLASLTSSASAETAGESATIRLTKHTED